MYTPALNGHAAGCAPCQWGPHRPALRSRPQLCTHVHYCKFRRAKRTLVPAQAGGGAGDGGSRAGGNGGRGFGGHGANGDAAGGNNGDSPFRFVRGRLGAVLLSYAAFLLGGAAAWDAALESSTPKFDTQAATVSVIIPALNEERIIADTVMHALYELQPRPCEVIVVDGGSTDRTADVAEAAGARIIRNAARGRGLQMNAGAASARGDVLLFLHADTRLPADAVAEVRTALASPRTVLVGFRPQIDDEGRTLWFSTLNNLTKTWYGPMLVRPASFVRGLRCLFGDQALCCRAGDFRSVGGFRTDYPVMEDAELCIALHMKGPADKARHAGRGRVRMLMHAPAVTSGRRIAAWGELRANLVFAYISLIWLAGASPEKLHKVYRTLYRDVR